MFNNDNKEEVKEYLIEILSVTKGMINIMSDDQELLSSIAQLSRKLYQEYINAGFTPSQAFELISKSDFLKQAGTK